MTSRRLRGRQVTIEPWWLAAASRCADGYRSKGELAAALSRAVRRARAWDRTTVADFLKGEHVTWELMDAFCELFDLPPCAFVARSYEEADQMRAVARRFR